jgi:hypothetical protein
MNRLIEVPHKPVTTARGWKPLHTIAAAITLLCAAPAFAAPITFESIAPVGYAAGETIAENGFKMLMLDGPFGGANGTVMDDDSCAILSCPSGNSGQYLGILNDGGVSFSMSKAGNKGFQVLGFDFAFLAPQGGLPNFNYGRLQLSGLLANGTTLMTSLDFPAQGGDGRYMFAGASLDSGFMSTVFTNLSINACMFDESLACVNSLDNPAFYTAQFALDNLQFSPVPEPVSLLLMGLGMGAMTLTRRRSIPSNNLQAQGAQA